MASGDRFVSAAHESDRLRTALREAAKAEPADAWLDLDRYPLEGVTRLDRYRYRIRLQGAYPQFMYWLAMPFFAPVPREVERFFAQPGMAAKNLSLDWWPIGTGPYMLVENNPNARMVLARNPHFRGESYPCEGEPDDSGAGLLADCGKPIAPNSSEGICSVCRIKRRTKQRQEEAAARARERIAERETERASESAAGERHR